MKSIPSIYQARQEIIAGRLKPTDLVQACLERIDRFDGQVQAWQRVDRQGALNQALHIEQALASHAPQGPLTGIPLGIKDIIDVAGWPTLAGSTITGNYPMGQSSPVVARLKAAGAIILGKTVTTEFAYLDPSPTHNPWGLNHTPGGSSSGSAASLAMGMCLGTIGSQTGGSIIRPAAYCGVCGFKPTFGRVSRAGVVPVSESLDHIGPLANSIADLRILWDVIADVTLGNSKSDPINSRTNGTPPRLGVVELCLAEASPEVLLVVECTLGWLESHGVELVPVRLPESYAEVHANLRTIMSYEAARYHQVMYNAPRPGYGPKVAAMIDEGLAITDEYYQNVIDHQRHFKRQIEAAFEDIDTWVLPSTNMTAPASLESTGDARFNSPWSYAGVPEVTFPCGLAENGMPIGIQLVGSTGHDDRLLRVAAWCEERIGFDAKPALLEEVA